MQQLDSLISWLRSSRRLALSTHLCCLASFVITIEIWSICSHVDDLVLSGEYEDLVWLLANLGGMFAVSGGEIIPAADQREDEPARFLKMRHYFTKAGGVILPNEKYIDDLVRRYGDCKTHSEVKLNELATHKFRSGMGTLLYLSQERLDIQHAVRQLSQYMSNPTKRAEDGLRKMTLYLKGTPSYGLLLPYKVGSHRKMDEIYGRDGGV